ncbi:hypothetical protein C3L33_05703, partial [Rhododendron williamsianum]
MMKFKKMALGSQEYGTSSEYNNSTSDCGLHTSGSNLLRSVVELASVQIDSTLDWNLVTYGLAMSLGVSVVPTGQDCLAGLNPIQSDPTQPIDGTEAVNGLLLNATNVQVNAKPFEKMGKLWYCENLLVVRRDGMGVDSIGFSLIPVQASSCLTELNLEDCHLSYLPDEIGNLISLRNLDLAQNNLSTSGIGRLISLEILDLESNSLCTLPDTIGKLSCLKELHVRYNKLLHLPSEIGDLDSLEELALEGNKGFRALPESICKLVRLQYLNLYDCNLSHLPSEIDRLISLGSLYLGHNTSLTLPDSIWHLTRLYSLGLGGCNLSHLPSAIGGLVSLWTLDIWENNICTIPDSISNLPRLRHFSLWNCAKLRSLPKLPTCNDGLSKLQHVVSILVPTGDEEVPILFSYHDGRGPNTSFVVPPSPSVNQKMLGWILRVLYIKEAPREAAPYQFSEKLYIEEGYKGLQLQGGDEVEIPIYTLRNTLDIKNRIRTEQLLVSPNTLVKKWAIDLIYEADEIHKGTDTLYQVVSI